MPVAQIKRHGGFSYAASVIPYFGIPQKIRERGSLKNSSDPVPCAAIQFQFGHQIRHPNIETRNKHDIRMTKMPNKDNTRSGNAPQKETLFSDCSPIYRIATTVESFQGVGYFGLVSCFRFRASNLFRASDFGFRILGRADRPSDEILLT
jgi:hypothetical protein